MTVGECVQESEVLIRTTLPMLAQAPGDPAVARTALYVMGGLCQGGPPVLQAVIGEAGGCRVAVRALRDFLEVPEVVSAAAPCTMTTSFAHTENQVQCLEAGALEALHAAWVRWGPVKGFPGLEAIVGALCNLIWQVTGPASTIHRLLKLAEALAKDGEAEEEIRRCATKLARNLHSWLE
jgi:hypothetical protein